MADVREQLRNFRLNAHAMSPVFGREVDLLIMEGAGLGEDVSVKNALDRLSTGLAQAAQAAQLSIKNYYDAMTAVNQMQQAHAAGVSVDTYQTLTNPKNAVTSVISDPRSPVANVFGVPVWVIIGGIAVYLLARR